MAARRDTVERPAFIPTRRPAPAAVQEVAKPKMPRGQFTLTGTAVVDQKQIAFLRETAGGKARSVRAGETINGVVVAEVKAGSRQADARRRERGAAAESRRGSAPDDPATAARRARRARSRGSATAPPAGRRPADRRGHRGADGFRCIDPRAAPRCARCADSAAGSGGSRRRTGPAAARTCRARRARGAAAVHAHRRRQPPRPIPAWNDVYRRMQQPRR